MSKGKKVIILLAALALLVTGLIVCRRREIPLTDVLPDGDWTGVLLLQGDPDDPEREWEVPVPADGVLGAVSAARVTRGGGKPSLSDGYFQINLHRSRGEATVLYVNARGEVAVAANMDLNHYRYYKGGEELYEALSALCADKTVYLALTGSI